MIGDSPPLMLRVDGRSGPTSDPAPPSRTVAAGP